MSASPLRKIHPSDWDLPVDLIDQPTSIKLKPRAVEKPWGRTLPSGSSVSGDPRKVGEIWFEDPSAADLPLLVKYIFTSEKLSVQVHPDDRQARDRGLPRGKSECWYIIDAEPGAVIGLGLRSSVTTDELRTAALDGSIETLLDWKPVSAGDYFYVPAGTVHALGAGITVLELQQNSDVTYRLYDYGRPRPLHLDEGIAVSRLSGHEECWVRRSEGPKDTVFQDGPHFSLVRATSAGAIPASLADRSCWVLPIQGQVQCDDQVASVGECLLSSPGSSLSLSDTAIILVAAEGRI